MKTIKLLLVSLALFAVSLIGYKAYSALTISELEKLINSNVEALAGETAVDQDCVWKDRHDCTIGTSTSHGNYTTTYSNHTYRY